jgi:hypothetical protein
VTVGQGFYRNGQRLAGGHHPGGMFQAYEGRVTWKIDAHKKGHSFE